MEDTDGFKDLQSLQKTIARANNARLPLEGDFHVRYLCSCVRKCVCGHYMHGAWLKSGVCLAYQVPGKRYKGFALATATVDVECFAVLQQL